MAEDVAERTARVQSDAREMLFTAESHIARLTKDDPLRWAELIEEYRDIADGCREVIK